MTQYARHTDASHRSCTQTENTGSQTKTKKHQQQRSPTRTAGTPGHAVCRPVLKNHGGRTHRTPKERQGTTADAHALPNACSGTAADTHTRPRNASETKTRSELHLTMIRVPPCQDNGSARQRTPRGRSASTRAQASEAHYQESQCRRKGCIMSICCAVRRTPLGKGRGGLPHFHFRCEKLEK